MFEQVPDIFARHAPESGTTAWPDRGELEVDQSGHTVRLDQPVRLLGQIIVDDPCGMHPGQQPQSLPVIIRIDRPTLLHRQTGHMTAEQVTSIPGQQAREALDPVQPPQRPGFAGGRQPGQTSQPPAGGPDVTPDHQLAIEAHQLDPAEGIGLQQSDRLRRSRFYHSARLATLSHMNAFMAVLSPIFRIACASFALPARPPRMTRWLLLPLLTMAGPGNALAAGSTRAAPYTLDIATPPVFARLSPLRQAAIGWSDDMRARFLQALPAADIQPPPHGGPWQLHLEYTPVIAAGGFSTLIGKGYSWTGGAHPVPFIKTLNYDSRRHRMFALADMFSQPEPAIAAICLEARRQLLARLQAPAGQTRLDSDPTMIEQGTRPGPHVLDLFAPMGSAGKPARALRILFPSYAVAPYVAGPQQVDISPQVFARWLKPEYRNRFQGGRS